MQPTFLLIQINFVREEFVQGTSNTSFPNLLISLIPDEIVFAIV